MTRRSKLAAAIAILVTMAGCALGGRPGSLPTWDRPGTDLGHQARADGTLVVRRGCLEFDSGAGLAWPDETEWNQATGEVTLDGVTAAVGDEVWITGFESARTDWTTPPTPECAQERWWSVESLHVKVPQASGSGG